ncbi:MAG: ATPase, T2SS/T4P/T4SS family [Candidatus Acidiferrales bacterium]
MKKKRLGEVLSERGHIKPADLKQAIQDQQGKFIHLGELILERSLVAKKDLVAAITEVSRIPYLDCETVEIEAEILNLVPHAMASQCCVLPIQTQGTKLIVAMAEPQNLDILAELRFATGMEIVPQLGFRKEIVAAIEKWYGSAEEAAAAVKKVIVAGEDYAGVEFISSSSLQRNMEAMQEIQAELQQKTKTTPAVRLVASMITSAAKKGASDIHVEPQAADTVIRFRIDGMLRDFQRIPRALQNTVASRIKILSDMDISERRTSQDGRFLVKIGGRKVDLRVSSLPTQYGEKVVMRLLESSAPLQTFAALGMPPEIASGLTRMLGLPQGMLLVTGPTGSGKSTTLYSSLNLVRRPTINIITVEDPVEYVVPGLNQVQVNTKAGLTFADCLRSILRQDPDVIMVGEIRDKETAEIAIKSAQTGHLVLSTLHTNDSIAAVTRLLDLGVPGFQISAAITGIVAQRLIRRICSCRTEAPTTPEYEWRFLQAGGSDPPASQVVPNGCAECDRTGYKGRIGIYEMLVIDEPIRAAIRTGGRNEDIRTLARQNGLKLMQDFALDHVRDGLTTLDEVQRVVPFEIGGAAAVVLCRSCQQELTPGFLYCPHCGHKQSVRNRTKRPEHTLVEQGAVHE